jgi:hypothetical protein
MTIAMKYALVIAASLLSTSAMASECVYSSGGGPRLQVSSSVEYLTVDTGDWIEICPLRDDERGNTHIPGASGWGLPKVAECEAFSGQFTFVAEVGSKAVVFNGVTFIEDCKAEPLRLESP